MRKTIDCAYQDYMYNEKNLILKDTHHISFEMVLDKIIQNDFIGPEINPQKKQFRIIVYFNE